MVRCRLAEPFSIESMLSWVNAAIGGYTSSVTCGATFPSRGRLSERATLEEQGGRLSERNVLAPINTNISFKF